MKFLIVDDHQGMRSTIRQLICTPSDTVMECASGDEALTAMEEFKPDCVTMDVSMPGRCAFDTMRAIRTAHPPVRMICVSSYDQADYRRAALEAGASGYVVKDNLSDLYLLVATKRLLSRLQF
ncbi:MAG TPA: response regulator transcription factor [Verrucomicrobiae bacterium]